MQLRARIRQLRAEPECFHFARGLMRLVCWHKWRATKKKKLGGGCGYQYAYNCPGLSAGSIGQLYLCRLDSCVNLPKQRGFGCLSRHDKSKRVPVLATSLLFPQRIGAARRGIVEGVPGIEPQTKPFAKPQRVPPTAPSLILK